MRTEESREFVKHNSCREAALYERRSDNTVRCSLCSHRCIISEGHKGVCRVRENRGGKLYTLVYGRTISEHVDPIEKKPLYHFHPGSLACSIATPGCNFRFQWCQNWEISQMPREEHFITGRVSPPEKIVAADVSSPKTTFGAAIVDHAELRWPEWGWTVRPKMSQ